jgi:hypothetical protein
VRPHNLRQITDVTSGTGSTVRPRGARSPAAGSNGGGASDEENRSGGDDDGGSGGSDGRGSGGSEPRDEQDVSDEDAPRDEGELSPEDGDFDDEDTEREPERDGGPESDAESDLGIDETIGVAANLNALDSPSTFSAGGTEPEIVFRGDEESDGDVATPGLADGPASDLEDHGTPQELSDNDAGGSGDGLSGDEFSGDDAGSNAGSASGSAGSASGSAGSASIGSGQDDSQSAADVPLPDEDGHVTEEEEQQRDILLSPVPPRASEAYSLSPALATTGGQSTDNSALGQYPAKRSLQRPQPKRANTPRRLPTAGEARADAARRRRLAMDAIVRRNEAAKTILRGAWLLMEEATANFEGAPDGGVRLAEGEWVRICKEVSRESECSASRRPERS